MFITPQNHTAMRSTPEGDVIPRDEYTLAQKLRIDPRITLEGPFEDAGEISEMRIYIHSQTRVLY